MFFALHAEALSLIVLAQTFMYERGGQTVSLPARFLMSVLIFAIIIYVIVNLYEYLI